MLKKNLKIWFFGLFFCLLLSYILLPSKVRITATTWVQNHRKIVYQKISNVRNLEKLLQLDITHFVTRSQKTEGKGAFLKWKNDKKESFFEIREAIKDSLVVLDVDFSEENYDNLVEFSLDSMGNKQTLLTGVYCSKTTLNPWKRFIYFLEREEAQGELNTYLEHIKKLAESVEYHRFRFSDFEVRWEQDTLLCFPKQASIEHIEQKKKNALQKIHKVVWQFRRRLPLDTARSNFLRYTQWSRDKVRFEVCVPLKKFPRKYLLSWLPRNKIDFTPRRYFVANLLAQEQDLGLGWDSLFQLAEKRDLKIKGMPLEKVLCDTLDNFGRKEWKLQIEIE